MAQNQPIFQTKPQGNNNIMSKSFSSANNLILTSQSSSSLFAEHFVQIPINIERDSTTLINQTGNSNRRPNHWPTILLSTILVILGQSVAKLLENFYYDQINRSEYDESRQNDGVWTQALLQTVGFPLLLLPFIILTAKNRRNQPCDQLHYKSLTVIYICIGIVMTVQARLSAMGKLEIPFGVFTLIYTTQLFFTPIFARLVNKIKFNRWVVISLALAIATGALTLSSAFGGEPDEAEENYARGSWAALFAGVCFSLLLCNIQNVFDNYIFKRTESSATRKPSFASVFEVIIFSSLVATIISVAGLLIAGEQDDLKREMNEFSKGKGAYVMAMVGQAVSWQVYWVGIVGLVFSVSSVLSNVISVVTWPIVSVLVVIFFNFMDDEFDVFKGVALITAVLSAAAYFFRLHKENRDNDLTDLRALDESSEAAKLLPSSLLGFYSEPESVSVKKETMMQTCCIHQSLPFPQRILPRHDASIGFKPPKLGFIGKNQPLGILNLIRQRRLYVNLNANDAHPSMSILEEETSPTPEAELPFSEWSPSKSIWRGLSVPIIAGQVLLRILKGKIHWRNTLQQLERTGPKSLGVCLLTSTFVGMAFTIQFVREFTRLGLNRSIGGVLALAFSRELSPVITSIVVAGRMGSAFAAELGTMQVSEQTDTLRVLGADPIDYLITPRVIASCLALPFLTLMCFTVGMASSALLSDAVYGISINIIMDSAHRALRPWDIVSAMIKSQVFGAIISVISCSWGVTTTGGAKGVGESTTSAVVMSLVGIFIADFVLSSFFFQGAGDSLKNCV
ncbi:unnamed protein product [Brassica oleracea]